MVSKSSFIVNINLLSFLYFCFRNGFKELIYCQLMANLNSFMTEVPTIKKSVHWLALQEVKSCVCPLKLFSFILTLSFTRKFIFRANSAVLCYGLCAEWVNMEWWISLRKLPIQLKLQQQWVALLICPEVCYTRLKLASSQPSEYEKHIFIYLHFVSCWQIVKLILKW